MNMIPDHLVSQMVPGLRVLSINTIIYSTKHCNSGPSPHCIATEANDIEPTDPLGQFSWLEERLTAAAADDVNVYILGHIPPIVGSYGSPRHSFWKPEYVEHFLTVLKQHSFVLKGLLFGHQHSDEWRSGDSALGQPILISSSITPIYDNNPSYKVVSYDRSTKALLDYQIYSSPILPEGGTASGALWPLHFTMSELTGSAGLTLESLTDLARRLPTNATAFQRCVEAGVSLYHSHFNLS
jgi:sphingomyelin phosphodiesterase acid-like 3